MSELSIQELEISHNFIPLKEVMNSIVAMEPTSPAPADVWDLRDVESALDMLDMPCGALQTAIVLGANPMSVNLRGVTALNGYLDDVEAAEEPVRSIAAALLGRLGVRTDVRYLVPAPVQKRRYFDKIDGLVSGADHFYI